MTQPLVNATYLYGGNAEFIEDLYETYLEDPDQLDPKWRAYFDTLQPAQAEKTTLVSHTQAQRAPVSLAQKSQPAAPEHPEYTEVQGEHHQVAVLQMINAYRFRGHKRAKLDPLEINPRPNVPDLSLEFHHLDEVDPQTVFRTGSFAGPPQATLGELFKALKDVYCQHIGAEYMHINDTRQKRWIQLRLEGAQATFTLSTAEKRGVLARLIAAEGLEKYLHTRYVGQKRFSLEGGESLIPLLDDLIQRAGAQGVKEIIIGMAHRGRLNVLVNILGKRPSDLFSEFEGYHPTEISRSGDVKYHQGFSSDVETPGGGVHIVLAFNPSHLEIIDPVVEGSVRARQERRDDRKRCQVLPLLIHGDAAFAGQGVVMETLNLSQTRGYTTGGTVHIVVNNQIGFTTSDPLDSRSTLYCSDVVKMVQAPIFHVNADDPEAVLFITQLALDYRMEFNKDVVVNLVCYRRHGHNEADEPAVTQPVMYRKIGQHPSVTRRYAQKLLEEGVIQAGEEAAIGHRYRESLDQGEVVARGILSHFKNEYTANWVSYLETEMDFPVSTSIELPVLRDLTYRITTVPDHFKVHRQVERILDARREMGEDTRPIDWGYAETLAYASVIKEGFAVRLSGQDSGRGTFFHRHTVLHDRATGERYVPLQHLSEDQPQFLVIDSLLSEEAVLAFEVGYAAAEPDALVIWEAQFGDFANNAQVVIDQFLSSSEAKWQRYCGLVLFLPHGFEGQGPEHSSARLERYLQLCAEHNLQVCVPSTPAQMFHMLRRQVRRLVRKPLMVMTPKSLLRHKASVSRREEFTEGAFQWVIDEVDPLAVEEVRRVVLCSGKVYYDLLETRQRREARSTAILRIEQLYPFPLVELRDALGRFPQVETVVWCQEEPKNQGAWYQIQHRLRECLPSTQALTYAGRPPSAAPAAGSLKKHLEQQQALVDEALSL